FDREAIDAAVGGIGRILERLGMVEADEAMALDGAPIVEPPAESRASGWVRARRSGIALMEAELGQIVERGDVVATVRDSVGRRLSRSRANRSGMVIGHTQHPLVNQGDAIIHIAELLDRSDDDPTALRTTIEREST
uniref:succinylglutamate desuccinylase/aspartoacylase family protein n=1 Tax=Ilumatobacter nonamiensis TaxID=467093 RepID=UPI0005917E84